MNRKIYLKYHLQLIFIFLFASAAVAQQVQMGAFEVDKGDLVADLKASRQANPSLGAEDFVKQANAVLAKQGLNFQVAFDAATCQKIEALVKARKNPYEPLNLHTALTSSTGEKAALTLPPATFGNPSCVPCFVSLRMLEITNTDFVVLVRNLNIKFTLPQNFLVNEAALVDNTDLKTIKRKWKVPFRSTPYSVSDDGTILYLDFPDKELSDISLMMFSEGVFQFCTKKEVYSTNKGTLLKEFPKDPANSNLAYITFGSGAEVKMIKFSTPCSN